jgi:hypothetical protein
LFNIHVQKNDLKWWPQGNQSVKTNLQLDRNWQEGDPEDLAPGPGKSGLVPLNQPMLWHMIKMSKQTGEIWCKIHDYSKRTKTGNYAKAMLVDEQTGKLSQMHRDTVCEFIRYNSLVKGTTQYQVSISKTAGLRIHMSWKNMIVARAKPRYTEGARADENDDEDMDDFGIEVETFDDSVKNAKSKKEESKDDDYVDDGAEYDEPYDDDQVYDDQAVSPDDITAQMEQVQLNGAQ